MTDLPDQSTNFTEIYGWLILVDKIVGKDRLKWKEVFELPLYEFFNMIIFMNDQASQDLWEAKNKGNR